MLTWVWLGQQNFFWLAYVTQTAGIILCNKFYTSFFAHFLGGDVVQWVLTRKLPSFYTSLNYAASPITFR